VISAESIERVRSQVKIQEVVGERVKLERRGRSLTGLCPFHKEKSPSFHVNDERGFYYCFGCHASGDAIKFLQELEGLSFTDAIRQLAERYAVPLTETRSEQERKQDNEAKRRRDELFAVNQAAATYYRECLGSHELRGYALAELERRGLNLDKLNPIQAETVEAFKLGYAPAGWDGLAQYLKSAGLSLQAAEKAGLVAPRRTGGGHYDRFRHRLMFAVLDLSGKVCAFSGRMLDNPTDAEWKRVGASPPSADDRVAKYVNSPETPIYKKRDTVFGLYQARSAVRDRADCLLVEGNFDVVSLHAHGVRHVVAPLGTAFTEEQAALIRRYSPQVTVLFDGDSAGKRAAIASQAPAKAAGLTLRVATLPEGQDPDTLVRARGAEAINHCARAASGILEYLIESALDGLTRSDPQSQGEKIKEVLGLIAQQQDPTTRALAQTHADRIASRLGISDVSTLGALQRAIYRAATPTNSPGPNRTPQPRKDEPRRPSMAPPERARSAQRGDAVEHEIFGALVEFPVLLDNPIVVDLFRHTTGNLALAIVTLRQAGNDLTTHLDELDPTFQRLARERLAAPKCDRLETALELVVSNLRKLAVHEGKAKKAMLIEALRQAQRTGDVEEEMRLLQQLQTSS
jgi:DNA primase